MNYGIVRFALGCAASLLLLAACESGNSASGPIFSADFLSLTPGTYTPSQLAAAWNNPPWNDGVTQGRASIATDSSRGQVLNVNYPAGSVGPTQGGAQWLTSLGQSDDDVYAAYWVQFAPGFDFVKEGKLPGLAGGSANTGGRKPNGSDGWSALLIWQAGGALAQYVYYPDQSGEFGTVLQWSTPPLTPGRWYHIEIRVRMNTPGQANGIIQGWLDGQLALNAGGLRFRDTAALAIDKLYFSTFFGGDNSSFAPPRSVNARFDDFMVSSAPISH